MSRAAPPVPASAALRPLLEALVAAKHELAFRCAYWAGRGPSVDASIALAGMAIEEEGHARVLEGFLADEMGAAAPDRDGLVRWDTWPGLGDTSGHRQETWPESLLRYHAQDLDVTAALEALGAAPSQRLAERARKMVQEEQFHELFALETLRLIAGLGDEARQRLRGQALRERAALEASLHRRLLRAAVDGGSLPPAALAAYDAALRGGLERSADLVEAPPS